VTAHPKSPVAEAFRHAAEAIAAQVKSAAGAGPTIRMGP
jgi:hypothetical protein